MPGMQFGHSLYLLLTRILHPEWEMHKVPRQLPNLLLWFLAQLFFVLR